jgi:nicotinate-nucleotide--dimethylbenzimidazole phosphoribosyltransferase
MGLLDATLKQIGKSDIEIMNSAQKRLDSLTKPQGSLGRLEDIAKQIAGITGKVRPILKNKVIFTFAADHGVTEEGVSAFPKKVTAQMVYNFLRGGAAINVLAAHANARVVVADLGVAEDLKPNPKLIVRKIGLGTHNMAKGQAMSAQEALSSIEAGIEIFNKEFEKDIDIVGTGEMGIGNTTASSAIAAVFTKKPVKDLTGSGTGINKEAFKSKVRIIEKAIKLNKPDAKNAIDVLAKVGGFEIGALAGVILAAASKKIPVVIDGFISGAAALIAYHLEPKVREYLIASHCSVERGHKIILEHIGLTPLFDFNLRLGEGTGAVLGIEIAEAAVKILDQMATFEEATVSGKNDL